MLLTAIVIVIILLLVGNVCLYMFNYLYPPCDDNSYIASAKKVPKSKVATLSTINIKKDSPEEYFTDTFESDFTQGEVIVKNKKKKKQLEFDCGMGGDVCDKKNISAHEKANSQILSDKPDDTVSSYNNMHLFKFDKNEGLRAPIKAASKIRPKLASAMQDSMENDGYS